MKQRARVGPSRSAVAPRGPFFARTGRFFARSRIQAKLRIGAPGDRFEREADRVADQVVATGTAPSVQRMCAGCAEEHAGERELRRQPIAEEEREEEDLTSTEARLSRKALPAGSRAGPARESTAAPSSDAAENEVGGLRGSGHALPGPARAFFERSFGVGFDHVRVHTDERAARLASALDARAFTYGSDVVFGRGEYRPGNAEGDRLLAHELTHVVQQQGVVRRKIAFGPHAYTRASPIGPVLRQADVALTTPAINNTQLPAGDGKRAAQLVLDAILPKQTIKAEGPKQCKFADFNATLSANVILPTEPEADGWKADVPGADIGVVECASRPSVEVWMTGDRGSRTILDWVESNEQEHVDDLAKACREHLGPYYKALLEARATGDDGGKCQRKLLEDLGQKPDLAVTAFLQAWDRSIGERHQRRAHKLVSRIEPKNGCATVKITSKRPS